MRVLKIMSDGEVGWITVHPHGPGTKGVPVKLDKETGEILAGMGGKFNGKHISEATSSPDVGAGLKIAREKAVESGWKQKKERKKVTTKKKTSESSKSGKAFSIFPTPPVPLKEGFEVVVSPFYAAYARQYKKREFEDSGISVLKETEKAYLVVYADDEQHWDGNEMEFTLTKWIPKSVVQVENEKVIGMKPWFAKKEGFETLNPEKEKIRQEAESKVISNSVKTLISRGKKWSKGDQVRTYLNTKNVLKQFGYTYETNSSGRIWGLKTPEGNEVKDPTVIDNVLRWVYYSHNDDKFHENGDKSNAYTIEGLKKKIKELAKNR